MNIKSYLVIALLLIGVNSNSRGQVTYNKRAIGAIGGVPKVGDLLNNASLDAVDMTTGTLKVGIPLYEIKVNDISVPITLSYSALGIKVNQEAGPAGMGWDLSVGGKISTNFMGKDDYKSGVGLVNVPLPFDIQANPNVFDPYSTHKNFMWDVIDGKVDAAWDTYSYSYPGGGGTYIRNGLTFPYNPLITIDDYGKKIKTTDGIQYTYGVGDTRDSKKRTYYEPTAAFPSYIGDTTFTREPQTSRSYDYDLASIYSSKFNETVTFNYENITDAPRLNAKKKISTSESIPFYRNVRAISNLYGGILEDPNNRIYKIGEVVVSQSKTEYIKHTRIGNIDFKNGKVVFKYWENDLLGRDVLQQIRIYEKVGADTVLIKRYDFLYDEWQLSYGHYLKQIDVYDSKKAKVSSWAFGYNVKLPVPPNVPSYAQDRWGFYNGATTNKTLLEHPDDVLALKIKNRYPIVDSAYAVNSKTISYTRPEAKEIYGLNSPRTVGTVTTYHINFANRNFDFQQALRGTLTSVKMPTGGKVTYEYEPHRSRQYLYSNGSSSRVAFDGGGIRIKSIVKSLDHDSLYLNAPEGKTITKKYTYGEGFFDGAGYVDETNGYGNVSIPGNVMGNVSKYFNGYNNSTEDVNNIMLMSHAVNNMTQYAGSYGAYQVVTENLMQGYYNDSYGKTVYYNNLPIYNEAPDRPWQIDGNGYYAIDNINLPVFIANPGVQKELMTGVGGIIKYAFKGGTTWAPVEATKYTFKSFNAPLNSQTKALSFFSTLTGQLSGPLPSAYMSALSDFPKPNSDGSLQLYNSLGSSGEGGVADYLSSTRLVQEGNTPNYPGKYAFSFIDLATLSNTIKKEQEQIMTYDNNGNTLNNTIVKYEYGNPSHLLLTKTATINSKGDTLITRTKYPQDYTSPSYPLNHLVNNKLSLDEAVEEFSNYKTGSTEYVKQATVNTFKVENNVVYNDKVYSMIVPGNTTFAGTYYNQSANSVDNNLFKQQVSYDQYTKGNVSRYTEGYSTSNRIIWGYDNQYAIAKVSNVSIGGYNPYDDVAYTSFESPTDTLNWKYSGTVVQDASGPFGKKYYNLSAGAITKSNSGSTTKYIVSYWYKNGAVVNISGGTVGAAVVKNTKADWTLVERELTSISGVLTISGTGNIDELRFHPATAQMTTYLYDLAVGEESCIIDVNGRLQYYEYDSEQRLKNIRDQDGNILKSYKYILSASN
ncbi:MAG: hypothetical protein V4594_17895 [Bacteroidota bacterium]